MGLCASSSSVLPEKTTTSPHSKPSKNETRPQQLTAISPAAASTTSTASNNNRPPLVDTTNFQRKASSSSTSGSPGGYHSRTPSTPQKRGTVKRNRWKKGDMIGAGSYGRVFMGLNMDTGGLIAIKELVFSRDNEKEVNAMQQEINLMKSLDHPNIVKYLGTEMGDEQNSNLLYIFTEWVPGGSLQGLISKFGSFDEAVTRKYTFQILQGLQFLHINRVVHRDIKGANILIDDKGTVKLADFGASKQLNGTLATLQEDNMSLRGTPYFMAPEVITQTGHGRKADVWSVGCTVLQMCTGVPPWKTMKFGSISALMYHVANTNDPPPMPDTISDQLRSFLHLCFQRNPEQRPSAEELLAHPFVSSVAADFASMTMTGNQMSIDLSQALSNGRSNSSRSGMSSISENGGGGNGGNGGNGGDGGDGMDAITFDERGAMGTNDVLGTLSLSSDATIKGYGHGHNNKSPAGNEPFDITSFSLVPNNSPKEASIHEYLSERGRATEVLSSSMRGIGSPDLNPFSSANDDLDATKIDDIVQKQIQQIYESGESVLNSSDNNPQEHSLTIEEQEEQRKMQESYIQAQERPLTTEHAVRNSQARNDREKRVQELKSAKEAAWQKELADELALQRSQRIEPLILHGDYG
jgi:serine/threonine protein kinase